jgi:hypothetical protein
MGGSGVGGAEKIESSPIGRRGARAFPGAGMGLGRGRQGLGEGSKHRSGLTNSAYRRSFVERGGGAARGVHLVNR